MHRARTLFATMRKHGRSRRPASQSAKSHTLPPKKHQTDEPLSFVAIRSRVQRSTRTIVLRAPADGQHPIRDFTFAVSFTDKSLHDIWSSDIISDWSGTTEDSSNRISGNGTLLTVCGTSVCRFPPNTIRVTNALLKLKRALANHSVPRRLEVQGLRPESYVPVNTCGDYRCLTIPGGKAYQWILESKYGRTRANEHSEIKMTKALCDRFFLDSRAAVRAPAVVTSADSREWIFINFPVEGTERALVPSTDDFDASDPHRHLNASYFALWSNMAVFFRLACITHALRAENPWLGDIRLQRPKSDAETVPLDADAASFYCAAVCHAGTGETTLLIGPRGSGRRTLAHHILSCCRQTQLVTSETAVLSLHRDEETGESAVHVTGCPLFHSVRVGTAIGSLFPNPHLEACITRSLAQEYLTNASDAALWNIPREIPVSITRCYGENRTRGVRPGVVTAVVMLQWDTARSQFTNDPRLRTLVRADPPGERRWDALDGALFTHVALPQPRFAKRRNVDSTPDVLPVERSAVGNALVGNGLVYRSVSGNTSQPENIRAKPVRWYEIGGEVNIGRVVRFCVQEVMGQTYKAPEGV